MNDDELTELARSVREQDDDGARDALLRAIVSEGLLQPPIRRFLFDENDVSVAEQQALVAVSRSLGQWSGSGSVVPWLRQIAANEAKMLIRSRDRRRTYETAASNGTADYAERMSSHLATRADLDACIAQLDDSLRAAFDRRVQGLSYSEISDELKIPEGTVKTRVRTARTKLAMCLAGSH